jgi:tRNA (cmo5U34)-methyltransferase
MNHVKKHFEEEAREFDPIILRLIPYYPQMMEALLAAIPFDSHQAIKVIDLGCGTGTIAKRIKEKFPLAKITCMDFAEGMISMARIKMAASSDIRFQVGDFRTYSFDQKYDVVVSSLALHHLETDQEKMSFYRKIYDALNPNGVFYNADVILAANAHLGQVYIEKWKEFMRKQVPEDEINNKWMLTYQNEDHPARLMDQLAWLNEIGFMDVDILWKYYNFAVYGGQKHGPL